MFFRFSLWPSITSVLSIPSRRSSALGRRRGPCASRSSQTDQLRDARRGGANVERPAAWHPPASRSTARRSGTATGRRSRWLRVSRSAFVTPASTRAPASVQPRRRRARPATRRAPLRAGCGLSRPAWAAWRCRSDSANVPSPRNDAPSRPAEQRSAARPARPLNRVVERIGVAAHGRRRVVQLVRQSRGQRAQRHHLLALLRSRAWPRARGRSSSRPSAGPATGMRAASRRRTTCELAECAAARGPTRGPIR